MDKRTRPIVLRSFNPFSEPHIVERIWNHLLERCPHSYFLSWGWKKVWLDSLPHGCNVLLVVGFKNSSPVVGFFVGSQPTIRHKFFKARQLSLNSTLIPYIDALCIEYNGILIDPEITMPLGNLVELLPTRDWDEFCMPGYAPLYCPNLLFDRDLTEKYNLQVSDGGGSRYVDLEKIRRNNMDYLAMLSRNKRHQIRRSLREYRKSGDIRLQDAQTERDALGIFEKLVHLHQWEWAKHGQPGAFSTDYMNRFHRALILNRFREGEIQLLEIFSGEKTIGCLYSFLYNGHVLFYQSGFSYLPENIFRPGLVCHYLAALYNAANGRRWYDFLPGEAQYKKSLSTDCNEVWNVVVQKRRVKYEIENTLGNVYHFMKKRKVEVRGEK